MQVVEFKGITRQVIDAINTAHADGPMPTVKTIILTRLEMDEFMATNPFVGGIGKFYGDEDLPSIAQVERSNDGVSVTSFYLAGVRVQAVPNNSPNANA